MPNTVSMLNVTISSGVPQGSNLGHLLFIVFINNIIKVIEVDHEPFADDLMSVNLIEDCISLQNRVNLNKLVLNVR